MPIDIYNKEFQNWLKGVFALNITRDALCKCVVEKFKAYIKSIPEAELELFFRCLSLNSIVQLKTQKRGPRKWHCEHERCKELMGRFVESHAEGKTLKYQWTLRQAQTVLSQSNDESMDKSEPVNQYGGNKLIWNVTTLYMFVEKGESPEKYQSLDDLDISKVIKIMRSCEIFIPDGSIECYEAVINSRNVLMHSSKNQMVEEKTKHILEGARKLLQCLDISDTPYYKDTIQELKDLEDNDFVIKYQPEDYKQIVAKVLEAKDIAVELHNAIDVDNTQCKSQSKTLQEMLEKIGGTSSTVKKGLEFKPSEYKSLVKESLEMKQETIAMDKSTCDEDSEKYNELQELEEKADQDIKDIDEVIQQKESEEMAEIIDNLSKEVNNLKEDKKIIKKEVESLNKNVKTLQEDKEVIEKEVNTYKEENATLKEEMNKGMFMYKGNSQQLQLDSATEENLDALYSVPNLPAYSMYDVKQTQAQYEAAFNRSKHADEDTEEYRNGYPGQEDDPDLNENYQFFMNEIPSRPQGDFIDNIHTKWWGDYTRLEESRKYMQWLFPVRRKSCNREAQELQPHEILKLQNSEEAMQRLLLSYKMMLDFYGMKLKNEADGTIVRAENWKERFENLNRSEHNHCRITRILKCLGEFGYEHLKKNFTKFVLTEAIQKRTLPNLVECCLQYWIAVLKVASERDEMFGYYNRLSKGSSFKTM